MSIAQSILPELDQEMAGTRKTLERIPEDKFDWLRLNDAPAPALYGPSADEDGM